MKKHIFILFSIIFISFTSYGKDETTSFMTQGEVLTRYFQTLFPEDISQKTNILFQNIEKDSPLYYSLQKGVTYGLIKNTPLILQKNKIASEKLLSGLILNHFWIEIPVSHTPLSLERFSIIMEELQKKPIFSVLLELQKKKHITTILQPYKSPLESVENYNVLEGIFKALKNHYDAESFTEEDIIYAAARGMANATGDIYTTFFDPVDSESFQTHINGTYEWIGAYVDMESNGKLMIISPMNNSPASKFGILPGDQILKIDDKEITESMTLQEAISYIKWPKGTQVDLFIKRWNTEKIYSIIRDVIKIDYVTYEDINSNTSLIRISTFWFGIYESFSNAMEKFNTSWNTNLILDLRNNGGGSLSEVEKMLNFFVPKDEDTVVIRDKNSEKIYTSEGSNFKWEKRNLIILINKGTASASEIMTGTIRDYFLNNIAIIGETSYGKGSVQNVIYFKDNSSFKYTIAKWFTGKNKIGIDGVGINPDIELINNPETANDEVIDFLKEKLSSSIQ